MIDAILYVPNFPALVAELDATHPNMLQRDETGAITMPPVVTGFARTPATTREDRVLVYARLTDADAARYRSIQHMEVLAETAFTGKGTADRLYQMVFDDPDALASYESVWQRTRTVIDPDTGGTREVRQDKFGHLAE
ncbi:hypothetical protein AWR38_17765 [Idiomarina sp. WRN-38]|nr:hypothetical protein AUR68_17745 [Idiomarina sp. H105]OAE97139.1 hypothetical protein AWR38_17765 [Idiomarina sp. WRN-38]